MLTILTQDAVVLLYAGSLLLLFHWEKITLNLYGLEIIGKLIDMETKLIGLSHSRRHLVLLVDIWDY
uniref:Secreted protein n=1 Tax=Angiostrongylus cantonensis TaxID=6313 RepID=A0A0K0DJV7_ANGCA